MLDPLQQEGLFDRRNNEKKKIHSKGAAWWGKIFYINHKEIWYVKLWINVWYEQNGKQKFQRPVLILRKLWHLFLTLPLTTKEKNNWYHRELKTFTHKRSRLILSQIKVIDKNRFIEKIGAINDEEFENIKKDLKEYYFSASLWSL